MEMFTLVNKKPRILFLSMEWYPQFNTTGAKEPSKTVFSYGETESKGKN